VTTALIADDEPVLRTSLVRLLAELWPELRIVAQARNGIEAVELAGRLKPDICFLDVQMPGLSGIEVAAHLGMAAQVVFCTAYDQHAIAAFERGALDYLLKPLQRERLAATVLRLRQRLREASPAQGGTLTWLRASLGTRVQLIPTAKVLYFRADEKYTSIVWRTEAGEPSRALVRMSLRELLERLDPEVFRQIHRAVVVNLHFVRDVERTEHGTGVLRLVGCDDTLPVRRRFIELFRQM